MLISEVVRRKPFRLHPGLTPEHYDITDSLRDIRSWRAYSHQSLTMQDPKNSIKQGEMAPVGYIMISVKDDTIVPMSRADEHHRGADVLYDEIAKECRKNGHPIDPRDYVPVWGLGNNYIYSRSEIPEMLNVLSKFLAYGGIDGALQGANDLRGTVMHSSDFVKRKGNIDIDPGTIAPAGQRVLDGMNKLAETLRAAIAAPPEKRSTPMVRKKAFADAIAFLTSLRPYLSNLAIKNYDILIDPNKFIGPLKAADDLKRLEALIFGYGINGRPGFKNEVHEEMKAYLERQAKGEKDRWKDEEIKALWGDVALAADMISRV